ncbi:hypothetical protein PUN28_003956 [Cardiocondyla obscurior]|uniref:Uncharacterized protein n=1 Tax=Cardiocondyla obscurior TaxID=286306 RepID=A0AAW2GLM6_9HYME
MSMRFRLQSPLDQPSQRPTIPIENQPESILKLEAPDIFDRVRVAIHNCDLNDNHPERSNAGQDTCDLSDIVFSKLRSLHEAVHTDLMCRWLRHRVSPFKITEINGRVHALLAALNLK